MEPEFWQQRWEGNELGFHQSEVNPLLSKAWGRLGLAAEARVLAPLSGKSLDLLWLHEHGHPVLGVELSRIAVETMVEENQLRVERHAEPWGERLRGRGLDLLIADFFALSPEDVGPVEAVYDRAALVAMPPEMRPRYVEQLRRLAGPRAIMLVIVFDYASGALEGPPFAMTMAEMLELFPRRRVQSLAQRKLTVRGAPVREIAVALTPEGA